MKKLTPHQEVVKAAVLAAHASDPTRSKFFGELSPATIATYMPKVPHRTLRGFATTAPCPSAQTLLRVAEALGWETRCVKWTSWHRSEPFGRGDHITHQNSALHIVRPTSEEK